MKQCNAAPVLSLIYLRSVIRATDDVMLRRVNEATADDPDELAEILHEILDMFADAARQMYTELGAVALFAALHDLASSAQNTDQRTAAALILAHSAITAADIVEPELRDHGVAMFDTQIHVINNRGRATETVIAVIDVWLKLLPMLTCNAGHDWLANVVET